MDGGARGHERPTGRAPGNRDDGGLIDRLGPRDIDHRLRLTGPSNLLFMWCGSGAGAGTPPLAAVTDCDYARVEPSHVENATSKTSRRKRHVENATSEEFAMSSSTMIVLAVIVVVIVWAISVYNGLIAMRQRVNQAFADVDVQLKQRHDLIPNLVETVKGYAAHERGTLDEVVKARNAAISAQGPVQQAAAENMLSGALRQLFALSESYPDLKASANFQQLQAELADLENKIAASRRFFNNAVQEYNTGIQRFPAALFASAFGFAPKTFFDLGDERASVGEAPPVKF